MVRLVLLCALAFHLQNVAVAVEKEEEKHDYNLELVKVEIVEKDITYFKAKTRASAVVFNDTLTVFEAELSFLKPLPEKTSVVLAGYEKNKATNQWMQKFNNIEEFCTFIEKNPVVTECMYQDTNLPRQCPFEAKDYYIRNMAITRDTFPKHLEESDWRVDLTFEENKRRLLMISIYASIIPE